MTEPKPITPEDLARILAYCEAWYEVFRGRIDERWGGFDFQAAALGDLPALVAEVRELRQALADALAELMDAIPFGAGLDLEAAGVAPRRANVIRRVGRIVKEASDGHV